MMLCSSVSAILFLSTPSARRATAAKGQGNIHVQISIHALREEGDQDTETGEIYKGDFYPRPPRGGRPILRSAWAACLYFYPRPPRGGRPRSPRRSCRLFLFLSTPSARRATGCPLPLSPCASISIHALREEGDRNYMSCTRPLVNFYPRPPRGGRPWVMSSLQQRNDFYPRPPRGGRLRPGMPLETQRRFLSTPSARRATLSMGIVPGMCLFLSTPSARRATC